MKNYMFYYRVPDSANFIRIVGKRKPSLSTRPRSGTWVVRELENRDGVFGFTMPCFPEITWGRLKELIYIGKEPIQQPKLIEE